MRIDHRLSKVQRNQLAELARSRGLDLALFTWGDEKGDGYLFSALVHRPTGARIAFEGPGRVGSFTFWISWWPNHVGTDPYKGVQSWNEALRVAADWLSAVAAENNAADLWAAARAGSELVDGQILDASFNEDERLLIAERLRQLEKYVVSANGLNPQEQQALHAKIDYLTEATNRLGKLDWKGIFVSTLLSIVLEHAMSSAQAQDLFRVATELIGPIIGAGVRYLGGG